MSKTVLMTAAATLALTFAAPALAQATPATTMVQTAINGGNDGEIDAVAKTAKATFPEEAAAIDTMVADYRAKKAAEEEARKREAGFLDNWSGTGEVGAFMTSGNTKSTGLTAGIGLNKEGIDWRHKLRAAADYQRNNGTTVRKQWMVSYEPNYNITSRLYAYGLAMHEVDKFQGFSARETLSGGLGYRVIQNDAMTLDVKGGPAWRKTNWIVGPSTSKINGLGAANFVWHVTPTIDFTDDAAVFIGSGNKTYSNVAALTAKFSGSLSGRLSYGWRHETNPPVGVKKTDTITRASIVYGF